MSATDHDSCAKFWLTRLPDKWPMIQPALFKMTNHNPRLFVDRN